MLCIRIVGDKTLNTPVEINEPIFSCVVSVFKVLTLITPAVVPIIQLRNGRNANIQEGNI